MTERNFDGACLDEASDGKDEDAVYSSLLLNARESFPADGLTMTDEVTSALSAISSCERDQ